MLAAVDVTITDNPVLTSGISAGLTQLVGTLTVKNNAALTDLGLPNLQRADSISIDTNAALAAIALPSLTSAPQISVRNNNAAVDFDMSALTQSTSVSVIFNQHLPSCEVRASLSHVLSNIVEVRNNDDNAQCP